MQPFQPVMQALLRVCSHDKRHFGLWLYCHVVVIVVNNFLVRTNHSSKFS